MKAGGCTQTTDLPPHVRPKRTLRCNMQLATPWRPRRLHVWSSATACQTTPALSHTDASLATFNVGFHLCLLCSSLCSIQWLFSTLSHKRCWLPCESRGCSRKSPSNGKTLTDSWDDREAMLFSSKGLSNCCNERQWAHLRVLFLSQLFSSYH